MTETVNNRSIAAPSGRDNKGQFTAGNVGRIPGSKNKVANGALADLRSMTPDAVDVVRKAIKKGDVKTATWLLERVMPAQRVVELDGADVDNVIAALIQGEISPTEAKTIAHSIAHLKNVSEIDDLREKLDALTRLLRGEG